MLDDQVDDDDDDVLLHARRVRAKITSAYLLWPADRSYALLSPRRSEIRFCFPDVVVLGDELAVED